MKFLYIVDHFVPFPQSEYGGIWTVVADNEEECFDLIVAEDNDNFLEYHGKLRGNISKSDKYKVESNADSKVVSSFLT